MATSIRNSSINGASTGTAWSVSAPSGTTTGDVVICVIGSNDTTNPVTDNNGSTAFTHDLTDLAYGGAGGIWNIFSRRIQGGDPSTYNFTGHASTRWTIIAIAVQNPDPTTIYDVAPSSGTFSAGTGTTSTAPTITTTTANAINICVCSVDSGGSTITATPAGYSLLQDGGSQVEAAVYLTIASPGATGNQTFTNSNVAWGAGQFAIKAQQATATGSTLLSLGVG